MLFLNLMFGIIIYMYDVLNLMIDTMIRLVCICFSVYVYLESVLSFVRGDFGVILFYVDRYVEFWLYFGGVVYGVFFVFRGERGGVVGLYYGGFGIF